MSWIGMRGVVAVAAAGSLPYRFEDGTPFGQRNMIIFLTYSVVIITLVVQGSSLAPIIRLLRLRNRGTAKCEAAEARRIILVKSLDLLKARRSEDGLRTRAYDEAVGQYEQFLATIRDCGLNIPDSVLDAEFRQEIMLESVRIERKELIELRDSGRIGDAIFRSIEHELDLHESKLLALR